MEPDRDTVKRLRHDLANPLSAILAEIQLVLLDSSALPPDVVTALRAIEEQALRMRALLKS